MQSSHIHDMTHINHVIHIMVDFRIQLREGML